MATAALTTLQTGYTFTDLLPPSYYDSALREDLRRGLPQPEIEFSPMWFYDAVGSDLFEQICALDSYYPTRVERGILAAHANTIARLSDAHTLIELGSGSSVKTRLLLDALRGTLREYIPLDVSATALHQACTDLSPHYPGLALHAIRSDFTTTVELPERTGPRLLVFLGSTIGNFRPTERVAFLKRLRRSMSSGDLLLLGTDLIKPEATLVAAYNDATTAKWNLNVLEVFNRAGCDFDRGGFGHVALWNDRYERIEMRLRARRTQVISNPSLGVQVRIAEGQDLLTEVSHKFTKDRVVTELAAAGLETRAWLTDTDQQFAVSLSAPL